jgi:hypothetical protein
MTNYNSMQNIPHYMNNPLMDHYESTGGLAAGPAVEAHHPASNPETTTNPTAPHATERQGWHRPAPLIVKHWIGANPARVRRAVRPPAFGLAEAPPCNPVCNPARLTPLRPCR